ncbi:hypothetical protein BGZ93_001506 [Podila epicladia]|nr:hypothetical protein BGZ92_002315 [Podila epicladia]KAG0097979.1 hypothetical protein BGZ93_001506 [Podila epicladia]
MDLNEQMSRLNHLHRTHILDCTADFYGSIKTTGVSSIRHADERRLAAWEFLRAKIVEQSRVVRDTTTTILSNLHGMGNKSRQPAPGSILLDSIPLHEMVIRGNITLENSILPVFRELSTLRSLKLVKINLVKVDLWLILDSFPELLELEMESVAINYAPYLESPRDVDEEMTKNDGVSQRFPLQRFRIQNFAFYQNVLETYLRMMPDLIDLRLVDLLRYTPNTHYYRYRPPPPLRPYNRNQLLDAIASSCPNLRRFQLSFDQTNYLPLNDTENQRQHTLDMHELSTRLPSSIQDWGFSERDMRDAPLLQLHHACFDRLTTLEVTRQAPDFMSCEKFHRMLCTNESLATLRHLKILGFVYNDMYLKMQMPIILDQTYGANHPFHITATGEVDMTATSIASTPAVYPDPSRDIVQPYWKCRNLLTLHIHLSEDGTVPAPELLTRRPLAYIVKLCPNLQELRIKRDTLAMTPMGGLCHLTQLEDLERLVLDIPHMAPVVDKNLAWMRQTYYAPAWIEAASGSWKIPWGLGRPSKTIEGEAVESWRWRDKAYRRRRGEHAPLSVKEAYAVGETGEVKQVLKKLEQRQDPCWPHLESFKVQIHWTHASNMQVEQLQRRLPHVLCRVGANVLDR